MSGLNRLQRSSLDIFDRPQLVSAASREWGAVSDGGGPPGDHGDLRGRSFLGFWDSQSRPGSGRPSSDNRTSSPRWSANRTLAPARG